MNVCDGVGIPTILIADEELCLNRHFDSDYDGWYSSNLTISRYAESTLFGSYVLRAVETSVTQRGYLYYQATIDTGNNQDIIFGTWLRGISGSFQGILELRDDITLLGWKTFNYNTNFEFYSILIKDVDIANGNLVIRIYPAYEVSDIGTIHIVGSQLRVINDIIELDYPTIKNVQYEKEFDYNTITDVLRSQENKMDAIRFSEGLNYEFMERDVYQDLMNAEEAKRLLFYPHLDADYFFRARITKNQPQNYLADKLLGHTINFGVINLEAQNNISLLNQYELLISLMDGW